MKVIVGEETWELDIDTLLNTEAILVERQTGWSLQEWFEALQNRSMVAMTCVVWIAQRRQRPGIAFDDIEFELGTFKISLNGEDPATESTDDGELALPKDEKTETSPEPS